MRMMRMREAGRVVQEWNLACAEPYGASPTKLQGCHGYVRIPWHPAQLGVGAPGADKLMAVALLAAFQSASPQA